MALLVLNIIWGGKKDNLINDISHHEFFLQLAKFSAPHLSCLIHRAHSQQQVTIIGNKDKVMDANKFLSCCSFTHAPCQTENQNKALL